MRERLKEGAKRTNSKAGLDIDVMDYSTDQRRSSESLSGGEAFFTSLALALGLSDVVQSHAGGRQLDALFTDEGFGTLSGGYLDKALEVLNQLTEGNRLVGIISHVDKLNESIIRDVQIPRFARDDNTTPLSSRTVQLSNRRFNTPLSPTQRFCGQLFRSVCVKLSLTRRHAQICD